MVNKNDHEIEQLNDRMEALVDELSNTRSIVLLNQLNNFPLIRACPCAPVDIYWLNILAGFICSVEAILLFQDMGFREFVCRRILIRLLKTSEEITTIIKNNK